MSMRCTLYLTHTTSMNILWELNFILNIPLGNFSILPKVILSYIMHSSLIGQLEAFQYGLLPCSYLEYGMRKHSEWPKYKQFYVLDRSPK